MIPFVEVSPLTDSVCGGRRKEGGGREGGGEVSKPKFQQARKKKQKNQKKQKKRKKTAKKVREPCVFTGITCFGEEKSKV